MAKLKTKKTLKKVQKYFVPKVQELTKEERQKKKNKTLKIEMNGEEMNDIKQALYFMDDQAFDKYEEYNPKFFEPFRKRCRALAKFFNDVGA